jgi:hypothetical protein
MQVLSPFECVVCIRVSIVFYLDFDPFFFFFFSSSLVFPCQVLFLYLFIYLLNLCWALGHGLLSHLIQLLEKFYLIETGFTFGELVFLVKVFRLFRLRRIFFGVESVNTVSRCTTSYLLVKGQHVCDALGFFFLIL